MDRVYIKRRAQKRNNHNAGGNWGAFEVLYLPEASVSAAAVTLNRARRLIPQTTK
jgi:hypothetical protein